MNKQKGDVINILAVKQGLNQREIVEYTGHSLGIVNRSVNSLLEDGYIESDMILSPKGRSFMEEHKVKSAIILAAGFGMRMVPINTEVSKGLLEVYGEPLVERHIKHLHEAGITDITIVVGFLKEQYEYLIDKYGVRLLVNPEYKEKNNLSSVYRAMKYIGNSYIIPCDIWCKENPFHKYESYSWYMVSENVTKSDVRINRKGELVKPEKEELGNQMIGISYISHEDVIDFSEKCKKLYQDHSYDHSFWEEILYEDRKMIFPARMVSKDFAVEINTYEQLRELDEKSDQLKSDAIEIIEEALSVAADEIEKITVLKKGMTNRSFMFTCKGKRYIMRIPGEGTSELINRKEEAKVYNLINGENICDEIVYINPLNGYKITEYIPDARTCDAQSVNDLTVCMRKLKEFHARGFKVEHEFDMFGQMIHYESLWKEPSVYRDYEQTKKNVLSLREYIDSFEKDYVLTHIDANEDNFLFYHDESGNEQVRLIDWEYAGMQDPHVDIAMFCIYSMYERKDIDRLIDIYFEGKCAIKIRYKIYAYIAICGMLWSNWCEYKRQLGVEFGEYSLKQYRYAKDYYRILVAENEVQNA